MFEKWTENFYQTSEYPVLWRQRKRMEKEKPFNGLKILDATPIFRNTLLKYEALISGGADLIVGCSPLIPADSKILEVRSHSGMSVVELKNVSSTMHDMLCYFNEKHFEIADEINQSGKLEDECRERIIRIAKEFGLGKSTVHKDVTERLEEIDPSLAKQARVVLDVNKSERHIRGGMATREKYLQQHT